MDGFLPRVTLIAGLLLTALPLMATPKVDVMTDREVTEYAVRISELLQHIQQQEICLENDVSCMRAEFHRHGFSYDDKESVHKRLIIMVGFVH